MNVNVNKNTTTPRLAPNAIQRELSRDADIVKNALAATAEEHSMTLWQGVKTYPKAIGWSILFSTALIMEGYDTTLMASFFGFPAFQRKFGVLQPSGTYEIKAIWQAGLCNAMSCGQILGLFANGVFVEKFGYRKTMQGALMATMLFILILFLAGDKPTLLVGQILLGIPLGAFQTVTVAYASEVCPVVLRAYLTTYINLCWVMGQLIASGVLKALLNRQDQWAYRIPFAVQWVWPVPIMIGIIFAPEGPYWLIRQGRVEDAKEAMRRLGSGHDEAKSDKAVSMIIHTDQREKEITEGTSYLDCFRGTDLRRTEAVCLTWAIQNLCGSGFIGYSTYFYLAAGLPTEQSFNMTLAQYGLGFIGTLFSWFLMVYFGRRTLYTSGLGILTVLLFAVGFTYFAGAGKSGHEAASWGAGTIILIFNFAYNSTVGPVCYSLVAELSSTRLKNKTIVLARSLYNIFGVVNGILYPYMLNPSAWNWGPKTGFFWGCVCLCGFTWAFFRLPEPKGRTYAELDALFERRISARKFAKTVIDPFEERVRLPSNEHNETSRLLNS